MKRALIVVALLLSFPMLSNLGGAQPILKTDRIGSQIIGAESLVSIIGEDGLVSVIGEDGLTSIADEDTFIVIIGEEGSVEIIGEKGTKGIIGEKGSEEVIGEKIIGEKGAKGVIGEKVTSDKGTNGGITIVRGVKTGRTLQLRPEAARSANDLVGLEVGDRLRLTVANGKVAPVTGGQNKYVMLEPELAGRCCTIVKVASYSTNSLNRAVTARDNASGASFQFTVPVGTPKINLRPGQAFSTDAEGKWAFLLSSAPGLKKQPATYSFPINRGSAK